MNIPHQTLCAQALEGVIDDFILREGTDYGAHEASLEKKRADVLRLLDKGKASIVFDPESDSITIHSTEARL